MVSIVEKNALFLVLLAFALLVCCPAGAKSPYLPDGQILWSSEVDFVEAGGTLVSHGDILEDLETYSGEGASILPGGSNAELIAAFFGENPEAPPPLPQKGWMASMSSPFRNRMSLAFLQFLTLGSCEVFFTTETNIELADGLAALGIWFPRFGKGPLDQLRDRHPKLLPVGTIRSLSRSRADSAGLVDVRMEYSNATASDWTRWTWRMSIRRASTHSPPWSSTPRLRRRAGSMR